MNISSSMIKYLALYGLLNGLISVANAATAINLRKDSEGILQSFNKSEALRNANIKEVKRYEDFNHVLHVRVQQTYADYPVWGADAVIHIPRTEQAHLGDNSIKFDSIKNATLNGKIYKNIAQDLSRSPALLYTLDQQKKAENQAIYLYQKKSGNKTVFVNRKSQKIIYIDKNNKAQWAYLISLASIKSHSMPAKPMYILNASTLEVYSEWDNIRTLDAVDGAGYGGNKKIGRQIYNGMMHNFPTLSVSRDSTLQTCYLQNDRVLVKDIRNDRAIVQYHCEKTDPNNNDAYLNDVDQSADLLAYSPDNDALYFAGKINNLYQDWFKMPVLVNPNNQPMKIVINTHEDTSNAWWDEDVNEITFGDGDRKYFLPFASQSIISHEISHGFTTQHSNLSPSNPQSAALHEAFSDMAAQAFEYYLTKNNSWKVGSEITMRTDALRYIDNPRYDCIGLPPYIDIKGLKIRTCSIDNMKDYTEDPNYYIEEHFSCGIFNKAFYLLSTSKGWDVKKAFSVMVQANIAYWTPTSNFADAACGVIEAAHDYGYNQKDVAKAFLAVGINTSNC